MKKSNTVIISLADGKHLYFGGDRKVAWGMEKAIVSPIPKVAKRNNLLLSGTGDAALTFELVHRTDVPIYNNTCPQTFIHDKLVPTMIKDLRKKGFVDLSERNTIPYHSGGTDPNCTLLVGLVHKNKPAVFEVEFTTGFILASQVTATYAHGCGGDYAIGAIKALTESNLKLSEKLSPEEVILTAIRIASELSPGCDNNADIISL